MMMKWGDNKTLKFIRLYQMYPCLWDTSSPDYNVRTERDEALDAIIGKMNIPNFTHAACKTKIKNIRSQYCHELKRIRLSMKGGGRVHRPTLPWFGTLDKFLRPIVVQRTQNLIDEQQSLCGRAAEQERDPAAPSELVEFVDYSKKNSDDATSDGAVLKTEQIDLFDVEIDNLYEEDPGDQSAPSRDSLLDSTSTGFSSKYDVDTKDRREESDRSKLATTMNKLQNFMVKSAPAPCGNEFEVFGQSVAAQLTNMPLEDALQLQVEIQQLITTRRIGKLSRAHDGRR